MKQYRLTGSYQSDALACAILAYFISVAPSLAHQTAIVAEGLASGFLHPFFGLDHVVAMVAVGLWGAFLGAPALWILPIVFPLVMAVGGGLGVAGIPLPQVEIGISTSHHGCAGAEREHMPFAQPPVD